jgi:hypothetical protein
MDLTTIRAYRRIRAPARFGRAERGPPDFALDERDVRCAFIDSLGGTH